MGCSWTREKACMVQKKHASVIKAGVTFMSNSFIKTSRETSPSRGQSEEHDHLLPFSAFWQAGPTASWSLSEYLLLEQLSLGL
ncbi:hypothetical protein ILYODFUR_017117 [Ilyodon furcidens]|uniref:Uncharacterized protein n=1 Tax=Ilyodon furcidens TaxID=33524 RepID=A0ABV0VF68_9TELE